MNLYFFIIKALCVAVIIFVQPVYSNPGSASTTKPRYKPSFEASAARYVHAIYTAHFSHHFPTKRQVSDLTADEQYCHIQLLDIYCLSRYFQPYIDIHLACGEGDLARVYANLCAQNEMGEYCQTLYYELHNVDPDLDYVDGKCSASLSFGSCHADCRAQLQLLKNKLGCCPFEYFNDSYSDRHRPVFDYRLWNLCNVPLSIPPCTIPHISQAKQRTCTNEDETRASTQGFCQPGGVGQSYVSKILDNKQCSQVYAPFNSSVQLLVRRCFQSPQGEYCGVLEDYGRIGYNISKINSHCRSSNASVCNQTCANTILEAKHTLGCCIKINLYNNSDTAEPWYSHSYEAAVSYDLWNSCGVELPGTCESTLSLTPSGSTSLIPSGSTSLTPSGSTSPSPSSSKSLMQGGISIWIIAAIMVFIQY